MKAIGFFSLFLLILLSCSKPVNCDEKINLLPMYGNKQKCSNQIKADEIFISESQKQFKTRTEAAKYHIKRAWDYFEVRKLDTAMRRFNQAWLLDSANADIYWGFGNILGQQQKFEESIKFFAKSLKINPDNPTVWVCSSISYGQLFYRSQDISFLDHAIEDAKNAVKIAPDNAQAYSQLTAYYTYFVQKDSARKYMEITDRINPQMINPQVREILKQK